MLLPSTPDVAPLNKRSRQFALFKLLFRKGQQEGEAFLTQFISANFSAGRIKPEHFQWLTSSQFTGNKLGPPPGNTLKHLKKTLQFQVHLLLCGFSKSQIDSAPETRIQLQNTSKTVLRCQETFLFYCQNTRAWILKDLLPEEISVLQVPHLLLLHAARIWE